MTDNRYILIMAGGVGSRFWPASRETLPKQFLDILNIGKSLLQLTYERCLKMAPKTQILIATNEKYKSLIVSQIPEIVEENILLEPSRNNTAPCIAYTAIKIQKRNPDACFAVMPSDHMILKEQLFIDKINQAFSFAEDNDALITLGIKPTRADTGYGYIKCGEMVSNNGRNVLKVDSFKEKPNLRTAIEYLSDGKYLWNAGIFIWSVSSVIAAFNRNAPEILNVLSEDLSLINTNNEQAYIDRVYPLTKSISVDFALMERSKNVYTIPADIGWSDLGTWNSLYSYLEKDPDGNVNHIKNSMVYETKNCYLRAGKDKLYVIKGLSDFIIIDEDDVLLIYPRESEQEIKGIRSSITNDTFL